MYKSCFALLFISFFGIAEEQPKKVSSYKNLTGSGEVFYSTVLADIQSGKLPINDTAFWYLDSSIVLFKTQKNVCQLSHAYSLKARLYYNSSRSDSATKNFITASKILQPGCPQINKYYLYNSWSLLAKQIKDYKNSDSLNGLAYTAALTLKDKSYLLNVLINKSILYSAQGNYKEAVRTIKEVSLKAEEYNLATHQLLSYQNLGTYYIDMQLYDSALFVYDKLNDLLDENSSPELVMDLYNNMGVVYENQGNYKAAEKNYMLAIELARKHNNLNDLLIYLQNYSAIKSQQKDYKVALEYLNEYINLKDTLFDAEKFGILKNLETQYQTAKQRETIFELEKKSLEQNLAIARETKRRNTLFFVVGGMLLIIIASLSRLNYVRRSKRIVEKEKKRSDELLLNILPAEVAEELKNTGKSEAKHFENVTVLFSDFKDFTSLSEHFNATELVEEINFYFVGFDNIISKYGVEKIKTIGDSYMAASGVPNANPDSAKTMVLVAIEMMALTMERNIHNLKIGKPRLDMRIGLHTGPVVAGIVGVKKFQFDIWGDTVNTASRMESACETNRVNISATTYNLIKDLPNFIFESRGKIEAKGKGQMEMYFVALAPKSA